MSSFQSQKVRYIHNCLIIICMYNQDNPVLGLVIVLNSVIILGLYLLHTMQVT